jgi:hypothetical protein
MHQQPTLQCVVNTHKAKQVSIPTNHPKYNYITYMRTHRQEVKAKWTESERKKWKGKCAHGGQFNVIVV